MSIYTLRGGSFDSSQGNSRSIFRGRRSSRDRYDDSGFRVAVNGVGRNTTQYTLRGGTFDHSREYARCACRYYDSLHRRRDSLGFRVAVNRVLKSAEENNND